MPTAKSAFAVYLYLCQQRMPGGKACPSQSVIAAAIGMARHTVNDALQRLASLGLILKAAVWKGKHSLYTVLLSRLAALLGENEGNKKELPPYPSAKTGREQPKGSSKTNYTVTRLIALVNRFFVNLTCAKIEEQYIDLTLTPKKEKKILTSRFTIRQGESRYSWFGRPGDLVAWLRRFSFLGKP